MRAGRLGPGCSARWPRRGPQALKAIRTARERAWALAWATAPGADGSLIPVDPGATIVIAHRDGLPTLVRQAARRLAARKVRVARRNARRANPAIRFEGIIGDVADDHVARRITGSDFLFLAADTMLARTVVNQIAYQYLILTLQVGSKPVIRRDTGEVLDIYAVVRTLGTAPGCLSCNGLIDPVRLAEESVGDPRQVINQRYVDDPDVHAPSVITLNSMGAGWAANDFMQYMTGLGRPASGFRVLRTDLLGLDGSHVTIQQPAIDPSRSVCGTAPRSARAIGDGRELPTRTS